MQKLFRLDSDQIYQYMLAALIATSTLLLMIKLEGAIIEMMRITTKFFFILLAYKVYKKDRVFLNDAGRYFLIPFSFIALHWAATSGIHLNSYTRNIIYAYALFMLALQLQTSNWMQLKYWVRNTLMWIVVAYISLQIFYVLFGWGTPQSGTTTNPHFLAIYAALCFYFSIYFFYCTHTVYTRMLFILTAIGALALVLHTSSRPTWIIMLLCGAFACIHLKKKQKIFSLFVLILLQILLFSSNVFNYTNRVQALITQITTEERTVIWADTWRLQLKSTPKQWLVGHGVKQFYTDFKEVSRSRYIKDFKSPHNSFLDVLYSSGLIGLSIFLYWLFWLFDHLLKQRRHLPQYYDTFTLSIVTLATIVFVNGLNFPLSSTSYIFPLALLTAFSCIMQKIPKQ